MEVKKQENKKKVWTKPVVHTLNIKKDTFSGSVWGNENAGKTKNPPTP